jgi:hypothetical protein
MTKDEALDLALEALEELQPDDAYPYSLQSKAITAIKQARALDKKAENARELGLDYEPEERYTYGTPLLDAFTKPAPVQEPVAIVDEDGVIVVCNYKYKPGDKLYTTPPAAQRQWVGLTDEEVTKMPAWIYSPDQDGMTAEEGLETFARAIEAKLREKNQ